ncbi:carboxylic ester hydrolase [Paenibacillus albidus]|uniref:Carboxylic ester hydrolase n=1 Tax=Paenibacillus albidus TaxID=2041023 RepID=A0A917FSL2_9BACL|nr:carboxylesterase family protein [Paenibacillus albidus]GGF98201.1 carboxylic ester hydrolase [Paenibacillus albidus]
MSTRESMEEILTISSGRLRGIRLSEVGAIAWLGIPYAKPPVGEFRWKAPRESEPWTGILPVRDFNNSSVQVHQEVSGGSEDCLYLNIWRPDHAGSSLPVFVFLHGGGNIAGSGRDFQGGRLACETNSIVLTVNYRLGAMGFFRHPALQTGDPLDDSGNYGLLDIIHALRWVQKNIHSFGGNTGNVTLAGQSAGARNALAIYLSPLGKGLFHKLFVMSGGLTTATAEQGEAKANNILAALLMKSGVARNHDETREWISTQSADTISDYLHSQKAFHFAEIIGDSGLRMRAFPHLFEDGTVIPRGGFDSLNNREHPSLPIILGSTASEFSGFTLMDPHFSTQVQQGKYNGNSEQKMLYEAAVQYGSELYAAFNVEQAAEKLATSIPGMPIFTYRFGWGLRDGVIDPSVRFLMGAPHGADIPFYTGDFSDVLHNHPEGVISEHNEPGRRMLSSLMRDYLRHFLYAGDPNADGLLTWQRWTGNPRSANILSLDASEEQAVVQSVEKLTKIDIVSRMEDDVRSSAEQRSWLITHLFAGRFFWEDE